MAQLIGGARIEFPGLEGLLLTKLYAGLDAREEERRKHALNKTTRLCRKSEAQLISRERIEFPGPEGLKKPPHIISGV